MKKERVSYYGVLILEGGVRLDFNMAFDDYEDVDEWINDIENDIMPKGNFINVTEEGTFIRFIVPINKILAYSLNG